MHNEGKPPPAQTPPLTVKRMLATDEGQRPNPVSLSPTKRSTTTNIGIRAPF